MRTVIRRSISADGPTVRRSPARTAFAAVFIAFLALGIIGAPSALAATTLPTETYPIGFWHGSGATQTRVGGGTLTIEAGTDSGVATADTDADTDWVGTWTLDAGHLVARLTRTTAGGTPETLVAEANIEIDGLHGVGYVRGSGGVEVDRGFLGITRRSPFDVTPTGADLRSPKLDQGIRSAAPRLDGIR